MFGDLPQTMLQIASTFSYLAIVLWLFVLVAVGTGVACGYVCMLKGRHRGLAAICGFMVAVLGRQAYEAAKSFGIENVFFWFTTTGAGLVAVAGWLCLSRKAK